MAGRLRVGGRAGGSKAMGAMAGRLRVEGRAGESKVMAAMTGRSRAVAGRHRVG